MAANANLHKAKDAKNDEFYTQLTDVSKELMHYKQHFKNKIVLCNCDDPTWSAFWKYFHLNFSALGLKKLISTHYDKNEPTYKMEYTGGNDNDIEVGVKTPLEGNGDFRNQECLDLLDEADIVVTNPPFSRFVTNDNGYGYVNTLLDYDKKFLIIGNKSAITCKDVFPLIRDNKIWIGCTPMSQDLLFTVPRDYEEVLKATKKEGSGWKIIDGVLYARSASIWFTNIDHKKRHEKLILWKHYTPEEYPEYSNYNAINVDKVENIPCDYNGIMGVPISFMDKYNPDQFEIIGSDANGMVEELGIKEIGKEWVDLYRAQGGKGHITANMHSFVYIENGRAKSPYSRILIRKKAGA